MVKGSRDIWKKDERRRGYYMHWGGAKFGTWGPLCLLVKSISRRGQERHFFQQQERVAHRGVVRGRCADFGLGTAVPWKQGETKKRYDRLL